MKFRALQLAYYNDRLIQPGDIVESDDDLSDALAPANPAEVNSLAPVYERVQDEV